MAITHDSAKRATLVGKLIIRVGVLAWFGYLSLYLYYGFSRPTSKQPDSGRFYPLDTHGHVAYLTLPEINNLHYVRDAAVGLFLVACTMALVIKLRERKSAQNQLSQ
jgi:hypothetical protein